MGGCSHQEIHDHEVDDEDESQQRCGQTGAAPEIAPSEALVRGSWSIRGRKSLKISFHAWQTAHAEGPGIAAHADVAPEAYPLLAGSVEKTTGGALVQPGRVIPDARSIDLAYFTLR